MIVIVDVGVIVIATVIVAVHVHGNDTVEVIATVDESAPRQVNGSEHDQGGPRSRDES